MAPDQSRRGRAMQGPGTLRCWTPFSARIRLPSLEKLREVHFDVLIVLTARFHGARLVTSNRADFEMISGYKKVQLEIW